MEKYKIAMRDSRILEILGKISRFLMIFFLIHKAISKTPNCAYAGPYILQ